MRVIILINDQERNKIKRHDTDMRHCLVKRTLLLFHSFHILIPTILKDNNNSTLVEICSEIYRDDHKSSLGLLLARDLRQHTERQIKSGSFTSFDHAEDHSSTGCDDW